MKKLRSCENDKWKQYNYICKLSNGRYYAYYVFVIERQWKNDL